MEVTKSNVDGKEQHILGVSDEMTEEFDKLATQHPSDLQGQCRVSVLGLPGLCRLVAEVQECSIDRKGPCGESRLLDSICTPRLSPNSTSVNSLYVTRGEEMVMLLTTKRALQQTCWSCYFANYYVTNEGTAG